MKIKTSHIIKIIHPHSINNRPLKISQKPTGERNFFILIDSQKMPCNIMMTYKKTPCKKGVSSIAHVNILEVPRFHPLYDCIHVLSSQAPLHHQGQ